jgi:MerR family copper efflux transcriptional regulator
MNISQAAEASGLSSKAIRYYEELGLVVPARDMNNSYRVYSSQDIDRLSFLQRARAVGFDLDVCRELLALYADPERRCEQVKALVMEKIAHLDQQVAALMKMRATLEQMAADCAGDATNNCAIINRLSGEKDEGHASPAGITFMLLGESTAD